MKFTLLAFIAALGFTTNAQKFYSEETADQIVNNLLQNNRRQYVINNVGSNRNNQNNDRWTMNSNVLTGNNAIGLRNQNLNNEQNYEIQGNRNKVSQQFSRGNRQNYQITGLENAIIIDNSAFRNQLSQSSLNSNYLTNLKTLEKNKMDYIPVWFDDQIEDQQQEEEQETSSMNYYNYYPTQQLYSSYRYPYASSYYSPKPIQISPWSGWQQWYRPQYSQSSYYSNYYPFMRRHLGW